MNDGDLYTSHNLALAIKSQAKARKVSIKDMLVACNLGSNTMSALYHGKSISFDSLARIADYLDCSVDYLLGRTSSPDLNGTLPRLTGEEQIKVEAFAQGLVAGRTDNPQINK